MNKNRTPFKYRGFLILLAAVLCSSACGSDPGGGLITEAHTSPAKTAVVTAASTSGTVTMTPAADLKDLAGTSTAETTAVSIETTTAAETTDDSNEDEDRDPTPDMSIIESIETYKPRYEETAFAFNTIQSVGMSIDGYGPMFIEADYGVTETVKGRIVKVEYYNHTDKDINIEYAKLYDLKAEFFDPDKCPDIQLTKDEPCCIDTSDMEQGLYEIRLMFSDETGDKHAFEAYFIVKPERTLTCCAYASSYYMASLIKRDDFIERRKLLMEAMEREEGTELNGGFAVDGSKSLQLDKFYYPNYTFGKPEKYRCDTEKWIELSYQITEDDWSKEHKVYVICDWLRKNIPYDDFARQHISRPQYYNDWSGAQSVWDLRTGKCWDYSNIFSIMCRAQGIPCTTIGSLSINHSWNIVMINGRWEEVDIANWTPYTVHNEDVSVIDRSPNNWYICGFSGLTPTYDEELPADVDVNLQLMYGDPHDKNENVSRIY